jgi:inosose dehydratase
MLSVGCQTYTWEMLGEKWSGSVDDILRAIAASGYEGIEITNTMIREYADRPKDFRSALDSRGLSLAAFAYASPLGFTDPANYARELQGAEKALRFVAEFPGVQLMLGGASSPTRQNLNEKIAQAANYYNEVGRRGKGVGVEVAFHPHSHHGSVLESREDYDRIMRLTDPTLIQWNPDTGHIVRGGQDLLDTLGRFQARIVHIHLKDVDAHNKWQPLGQGICDIPAVLKFLEQEAKFSGWVVAEEESDSAEASPEKAITANRQFLKSIGH